MDAGNPLSRPWKTWIFDEGSMIRVIGIKGCDACRKAMLWLSEHQIAFDFLDIHKCPLTRPELETLALRSHWEWMLNRRSTTYRNLPEDLRAITSHDAAMDLMCRNPLLMKRPLLEDGDQILIGFSPESYEAFFNR